MANFTSVYKKLYKAFLNKKEEVIHKFLSKKKNESASGRLLCFAYMREHYSFFEFLVEVVEHNADVNWKDESGKSVLEFVVGYPSSVSTESELICLKSLLNHGVDINVLPNAVYKAATFCNIQKIKLLLEKGMDVNSRVMTLDEYSRHFQCVKNCYSLKPQLTVVEIAISHSVFCTYNIGYHDDEREEIIRLFLENGAIIYDDTNQIYTLHFAIIIKADLHIIKTLIEYGANINSLCKNQYTPLSHAVLHSNKEIIFYLLKNGATFNVNSINSVLHNYLLESSIFCQELFALIVDSGADINSKNESGDTPLHHIVKVCSINDGVQFLLHYGSNINAQNENGNTPLHFAIQKYMSTNILILLENEVDHSLSNAEGRTPLMDLKLLSGNEVPGFYYSTFESKIRDAFHFQIDDFTTHEKLIYCFVRVIITDAESGKPVNEGDLHFVKTRLRFLYDRFKSELEKAKLKKIRRNISYYDILTKSVSVLETSVNRTLLENIRSSYIEIEFPLYCDMLRKRIEKTEERKILIDFCEKRFKNLFHVENDPPILIIDKIIIYLSSVDLITLWRVFKGKEDLSAFLNCFLSDVLRTDCLKKLLFI